MASLVMVSIAAVIGCGGSSDRPADPAANVAPGDPAVSIDGGKAKMGESDTKPMDAPGGMQMPTNATIDMPAKTENQPKSGGFTLPTDGEPQTNRKPPVDEAADAIHVQFADWPTIAAKANANSNSNANTKLTVIDLWSLSCEPCLKEFPGLVRLHQSHADKVQCIAVNVDFDGRKRRPPEYYQDAVKAFLASVNASGFASYICATPSDDVFEAAGIISIPSVLIYDADGKLVQKFVDAGETIGFTYEKDIEPLIEKLVARK